jgi:hypothetical protein
MNNLMPPKLRKVQKKVPDVFLDKRDIIDTDFYCPYTHADGSIDKEREIFEFCIFEPKLHFKPDQQFLMTDIMEVEVLRYLVLSTKECLRHPGHLRVRCISKGKF